MHSFLVKLEIRCFKYSKSKSFATSVMSLDSLCNLLNEGRIKKSQSFVQKCAG